MKEQSVLTVPIFSCKKFADEFRHNWDSPDLEKLICIQYHSGSVFLKKLAESNATFVIDHGHQGLILAADYWRPIYDRYEKGQHITVLKALGTRWKTADTDDFPIFVDRLTGLMRSLRCVNMAWLIWLEATATSPSRLCLVTASLDPTYMQERICVAMSFLADDLTLPPLAYFPVGFATKELASIPAELPMFYSDELSKALDRAAS